MPGTLGRDDNANPGPYFSQGSATPWRTHSCVQRSHSCERVFAADRTCSQECEHGRHESAHATLALRTSLLPLQLDPQFGFLEGLHARPFREHLLAPLDIALLGQKLAKRIVRARVR